MKEETREHLMSGVETLKYNLTSVPDGLRGEYTSPCFEAFFKKLSAELHRSKEPVIEEVEGWGGAKVYNVEGFFPNVPGLFLDRSRGYFFDRDMDGFNIFPLTTVGLSAGIQVVTKDVLYAAEADTLTARFKDLIAAFYLNYMRPVNIEVTLTFTKEQAA